MKSSKADCYQIITDRIVSLLQNGVVPWQKPWRGGASMPRNLVSGNEYRGINIFLLAAMSYESPHWLTFNQALDLGGNVRKGEKACPVVFWKWFDGANKENASAIGESSEVSSNRRVPFLRYYSVFNLSQCENIPADKLPSIIAATREHSPIAEAESIVSAMPNRPSIQHGKTRACYRPSSDVVEMPASSSFRTGEDYYSTLFHELTHSTGHAARLNRKGIAGNDGEWSAFGSAQYAREELVAEMGAAFLAGHAGIVDRTVDNSAAYVAAWLERLKEDSRLVVTAAAQAQRASDYILNRKFDSEAQGNSENSVETTPVQTGRVNILESGVAA